MSVSMRVLLVAFFGLVTGCDPTVIVGSDAVPDAGADASPAAPGSPTIFRSSQCELPARPFLGPDADTYVGVIAQGAAQRSLRVHFSSPSEGSLVVYEWEGEIFTWDPLPSDADDCRFPRCGPGSSDGWNAITLAPGFEYTLSDVEWSDDRSLVRFDLRVTERFDRLCALQRPASDPEAGPHACLARPGFRDPSGGCYYELADGGRREASCCTVALCQYRRSFPVCRCDERGCVSDSAIATVRLALTQEPGASSFRGDTPLGRIFLAAIASEAP